MAEYSENIPLDTRAKVRRILLFRSARMWQVSAAADKLHAAFPDAVVDVLCQSGATAEAAQLAGVHEVIEYPGGKFLFGRTPLPLLARLARGGYDLAVIVYNNVYGEDYEHVHALAWITGARHELAYNLDGEWLALTGPRGRPAGAALLLPGALGAAAVFGAVYAPVGAARLLARRLPRRPRGK